MATGNVVEELQVLFEEERVRKRARREEEDATEENDEEEEDSTTESASIDVSFGLVLFIDCIWLIDVGETDPHGGDQVFSSQERLSIFGEGLVRITTYCTRTLVTVAHDSVSILFQSPNSVFRCLTFLARSDRFVRFTVLLKNLAATWWRALTFKSGSAQVYKHFRSKTPSREHVSLLSTTWRNIVDSKYVLSVTWW